MFRAVGYDTEKQFILKLLAINNTSNKNNYNTCIININVIKTEVNTSALNVLYAYKQVFLCVCAHVFPNR